jgi:PAS domain-containing protein
VKKFCSKLYPLPVTRLTDLRRADEELRGNYEKLRSAEEVVRQDRDRLNLIIENVGDPIVVCDREAKVVLLDPLAQELFGTDRTTRNPNRIRNQARLDAYIASFTYSFSDRESQPLRLVDLRSARTGRIYRFGVA